MERRPLSIHNRNGSQAQWRGIKPRSRFPAERGIQGIVGSRLSMIGPEEIWAEAVRTLEREKPFALATVVNVRGPPPREVGAKSIVRGDGQVGTIGGGAGEAAAS